VGSELAVAELALAPGSEDLGSLRGRLPWWQAQSALHAAILAPPAAARLDGVPNTHTIKLIAYRAETALVQVVRDKLQRSDDARALVRQVFHSAADLCPQPQQKALTVRPHRLSSAIHDAAMEHLSGEMTATETVFPGTELRLIFEPVGFSGQTTLIPPHSRR